MYDDLVREQVATAKSQQGEGDLAVAGHRLRHLDRHRLTFGLSNLTPRLAATGEMQEDVAPTEPNPLRRLTLTRPRRTSEKWQTRRPLPLCVAEMDVPLAEPVGCAVTDAIALGDTGYVSGTGYAEALAGFAAARWGWDDMAMERTVVVPDVMLGIIEVLSGSPIPATRRW